LFFPSHESRSRGSESRFLRSWAFMRPHRSPFFSSGTQGVNCREIGG
jgi:hypothetical protein